MSIYVNNFFFISNSPKPLALLKNAISNKYNVKNLRKVKAIIKQQVTKNLKVEILKI